MALTDLQNAVGDYTAAYTSPGILDGIGQDESIRFTAEELPVLDAKLAAVGCNGADRCIIGAVCGGALQNSDMAWYESNALTAQTFCKTDVTFDDAMSRLVALNSTLAAYIQARAHAVGVAVKAEKSSQDKEVYAKEAAAIGGGVKDAAVGTEKFVVGTVTKAVDTGLGLVGNLPWIVLGIGVFLLGGAIIYINLEKEGG